MHLIVAVDGSDAALQACRLVAAYAGDAARLQVLLLNVQRPPVRFSQGEISHAALEQALLEEGQRHLAQAHAVVAQARFPVASLVRIGAPADTILHEVRTRGAGALVLGGGRHGLLGGYAIGSVALRVAPAVQCPVVLVGAQAQLPVALGRTLRVAAAVDGSAEATRAVERLAECAPLLGRMQVDLVHFQPGLSLAAAVLPPHDDVVRHWSALETDEAFTAPVRALTAAGIPYELHRLTGEPDVGIAAFARQRAAEAVVMATRGRGAMHHLLMGSVALRTARESPVPVALMR